MREMTAGRLRVRLTGGDDREGGGTGPLVVLMHGFGAPGNDLVPLWRELAVPRTVRFAFPEAPLELDLGMSLPGYAARAWWMIDMVALENALARGELRDLTTQVPEGLAEAREAIVELLDALEREVQFDQLVLGGFSQGAMLALDVALRTERKLKGLILLSTTFLAEHEWTPLFEKRAGLPVIQSHGRADPLLPYSIAEMLRDRMIEKGMDVRFVPFNGGHEISANVLDEVGAFVSRLVD